MRMPSVNWLRMNQVPEFLLVVQIHVQCTVGTGSKATGKA